MADRALRLTGPIVAAAALAAALGFPPEPNDSPVGPDFGTARSDVPTGTAAPAGPQDPAEGHASAGPHSPRDAAQAPPPPVRVLAPGVGLDARVGPVGVTAEGDMAVPEDPSEAGWYRYGPAPGGDRGSAVLVGHVDDDTGEIGEFAALYDVRPGDRIEVRRAQAEPVRYRVVARETVPKDEPPASVFRRSGAPVLTLITCAPPFVPERGGYLSNLVVTAEPVESGRA
ncbi:class F sortase [Streptomyces pseudogriseolus]|uniref:Class F sortase n=1 Tax=Streptomyces pseudogriseolus TaxID=36817 RepID=A0ABQ2SID2_STREZ|nr:class F sortase [Streptomyces gancidicus]GGS27198.1 class F sortase [Streptomyces rubiginosus]